MNDPMYLIKHDTQFRIKVLKTRKTIEEYFFDKDECTCSEIGEHVSIIDKNTAVEYAFALIWLVNDRWLQRVYMIKNLSTGEYIDGWYNDIRDIGSDGLKISLKDYDLETIYTKTALFGKKRSYHASNNSDESSAS